MKYIAHIRSPGNAEKNPCTESHAESDLQSVKEHLDNTARLAESFSIPELKDVIYNSGLLHDVGKYQMSFQEKIRGRNIAVDHSTCGAQEAKKRCGDPAALIMEYIIAGHHAGIPNGGTNADDPTGPSLSSRLQKSTLEPYDEYRKDVTLRPMPEEKLRSIAEFLLKDLPVQDKDKGREMLIDEFAFIVRYCYSCLVDADSIDTEHFCREVDRSTLRSDYQLCLAKLEERFRQFSRRPNQTRLQAARFRIQDQAYRNIQQDADIYLMGMPTGSGKTLCSTKCALMKAIAGQKRHIIYIIPYNSIITQTVRDLEEIFNGDGTGEPAAQILRHQSTYSVEDDENADDSYKVHISQATENWDADIIITTVVQFFETVFSNRRGKLRKMHNMADSIIIFDEAHLMPIEYFQPCLESIAFLVKKLRSQAILLTATMPDYPQLLRRYTLEDLRIRDLIPDQTEFPVFQKCTYQALGEITPEALAIRALEAPSTLIVVNSRRRAREISEALGGETRNNLYHLSTYMTKRDLQDDIEEIREKLTAIWEGRSESGQTEPLIVVSTSLIEAGVDLDFHAAFRECTGLDSILQTGGRCNREGRLDKGSVCIFEIADDASRHKAIDIRTSITKDLIRTYPDISAPDCIREYYRRVYETDSGKITENAMYRQKGAVSIASIPFSDYNGKLIASSDESVVVPENEEAVKLIRQMRFGGITRKAMRSVQKYTCSVPRNLMISLREQGVVRDITDESGERRKESGIFVLENMDYYHRRTGIQTEGVDKIL